MKRVTLVLIPAAIICVGAILLAADRSCCADEKPSSAPPTSTGPAETAVIESAMFVRLPAAIAGIWPREELLRKAKPANFNARTIARREEWFGRVLKKSIQPKDAQWNSKEWLIASKLRWNTDFLVGHFPSCDPKISRIEFQETGTNLTITIVSEKLFPKRQYRDKETRELLGTLLNIPEDCLPHITVDSVFIEVGSDKKAVTYGKIFDERNKDPMTNEQSLKQLASKLPTDDKAPEPPPANVKVVSQPYKPLIPEEKSEWFSPLFFCICDGRLIVSLSTIDWKSDDRPMGIGIRE